MDVREAQEISDAVVNKIKKNLYDQGHTSYWLAQQCNLTEAALSYIFNHKRHPTLHTLLIISEALNIKLSDVLKDIDQ